MIVLRVLVRKLSGSGFHATNTSGMGTWSVAFRIVTIPRGICGLMLLAMFLAACGGTASTAVPPSASKTATDLSVTAQRKLALDNSHIIALSPDGKWLAAARDKALCIIAVDTLADKHCVSLETGPIDRQSIVWSPDGKRVAFTENLVMYFYESDLWMLDIDSGQLTNLTDDGLSGGVLKLPKDVSTLDTMLTWSPDSQTLLFSRSARSGSTALYQISANGGTPQKVLDIQGKGMAGVSYGPRWLPNGKIIYTVHHSPFADPVNGVWIADSNGQNAKQLLKFTDRQQGLPTLRAVSAKGDLALIYYAGALPTASKLNLSDFVLLDVNSGQTVPLMPTTAGDFLSVTNATLSADGSKVLYVYWTRDKQAHLAVRDVKGQTETNLLTQSLLYGATDSIMQGLDWASNDSIYVATSLDGGWLLTLGSK